MSSYNEVRSTLRTHAESWLVTGAAGFIGSHLVENLLAFDQEVVSLNKLSPGLRHNLDDVRSKVTEAQWQRFSLR